MARSGVEFADSYGAMARNDQRDWTEGIELFRQNGRYATSEYIFSFRETTATSPVFASTSLSGGCHNYLRFSHLLAIAEVS